MRQRETACEIFQCGWRSSQIISTMQKCQHPHTFLKTQIRNVLQKWVSRKNCVYTNFPNVPKLRHLHEDQDYKGSSQEAHWRTSTSAENIGDFDNSRSQSSSREYVESRNNHGNRSRGTRLSHSMDTVVPRAQHKLHRRDKGACKSSWSRIGSLNSFTLTIPSNSCKAKTSEETERSLRKFFRASEKPEDICTDNSLEFGTSCEDLPWNHGTTTPHRSETNGIAEESGYAE